MIFPEKIITASVEVFPNIKREDAISVLEKVFGVSFEERDANEYQLYEAEENGVSYRLALNYDWYLEEKDKMSIEVHITSHWEDRQSIPEAKLPFLLSGLPSKPRENMYGHIVVSEHVAKFIKSRTGYRYEIDDNET